jgi:hypothetical protein
LGCAPAAPWHQDDARSAEAALRAAFDAEPFLQRRQFPVLRHAFNGGDFDVRVGSRQHHARKLRHTVHQHGAAAAARVVAAALGARQAQIFAQDVEQQLVRRRGDLVALAVDLELNGLLAH